MIDCSAERDAVRNTKRRSLVVPQDNDELRAILGEDDWLYTDKPAKIEALLAKRERDVRFEALLRHTWMKDGVTYVGNGTYTLVDARVMLDRDYPPQDKAA